MRPIQRRRTARRRGRTGGAEDAKLHRLLAEYEAALHDWTRSSQDAVSKGAGINYLVYGLSSLYTRLANAGAYEMFLTLLRTYQYDPKMRKALEKAAQTFSRTKKPSLPRKILQATNEEKSDVVQETVKGYAQLGELARRAIDIGRPCGEGDVCSAGCFRLVNAGGFGQADVEHVRALTDKAAEIIQAHGFGDICYGDVQIVRQVSRANVLAHYMIGEDQIYVRGNLPKNNAPTLRTILHELGHRLEHKFFDRLQSDRMRLLFQRYGIALKRSSFGELAKPPTAGERLTIKGEHYVVLNVGFNQALNKVISLALANPQDENERKFRFSIPLDAWLRSQGHKRADDKFVSNYAKTNPGENFAEMFAEFCLNKLNDEQKRDFLYILKG